MPAQAPLAINALLDRMRVRFAGQEVHINDGPPIRGRDHRDAISIGDGDDLTQVRTVRDFDLRSMTEPVDVDCIAESWSGSDDRAAVRARVFALLDEVEAELAADPHLGLPQTVFDAVVIGWALRVQRTAKNGAVAALPFTVRIKINR